MQLGMSNPSFQMKKLRLGNNYQKGMEAMNQKQISLGQRSFPSAPVTALRGLPLGPLMVIPKPGY